MFTDDATRWKALQVRDAAADGLFVYGVKSTGIYCRPTCKARLARRANVSFYETGAQAQLAGFRPCKRCTPEAAGPMPETEAVAKIRALLSQDTVGVEDGGDPFPPLSRMAEQVGLSKWHFHRVFKKCTGITPIEYRRLQRASRIQNRWNDPTVMDGMLFEGSQNGPANGCVAASAPTAQIRSGVSVAPPQATANDDQQDPLIGELNNEEDWSGLRFVSPLWLFKT
jgi:methylphosphotriester-DNA--protein-cysteine methyltransferase